ncbi:MAG TPA: prephenate dehydrogenase/arogenate dehydrogenase family protein [Casimicrobiaceae bacterium]|nr:prephenate dehydrogenase/arogenate dehydrogenase family protein [Casimicrobiaceae bacterium]
MASQALVAKLAVIGVGLIGGSFALALKRAGAVREVIGVGRTRANLDEALQRDIVDRAVTLDSDWVAELRDADVVLLATPVAQYGEILRKLAPHLRDNAIVTDAGSTKQDVIRTARETLGDRFQRFVPAHPVAGSEQSGAAAADARLYVDKVTVLTPTQETAADALRGVEALWRACGSRVLSIDAAKHDRILGAISHLPHLLAFAYVDAVVARPDANQTLALAGSGFRDFTRIAGSSSEMWRDIALANRDALLAEMEAFRNRFDALEAAVRDRDAAALGTFIARAAQARRRWSGTAGAVPCSEDEA